MATSKSGNTKAGGLDELPSTKGTAAKSAPAAAAPARRTMSTPQTSHDDHEHGPTSLVNTTMSALPPDKIKVTDGKKDEMVMVHVPKGFRLMDDHRHVHHYDVIGKQAMPLSHAIAPYAKANGVTFEDPSQDPRNE